MQVPNLACSCQLLFRIPKDAPQFSTLEFEDVHILQTNKSCCVTVHMKQERHVAHIAIQTSTGCIKKCNFSFWFIQVLNCLRVGKQNVHWLGSSPRTIAVFEFQHCMARKGTMGGCLHGSRAAKASGPAAWTDSCYTIDQRWHFQVVTIDSKFMCLCISPFTEDSNLNLLHLNLSSELPSICSLIQTCPEKSTMEESTASNSLLNSLFLVICKTSA